MSFLKNTLESSHSWSSAHAWKACMPKGIEGSNPSLSAHMTKSNEIRFNTIETALEDVAAGKIIIIADDKDRENEGDFFCAAEKITPEKVNFMISKAKGLLVAPLTEERCKELDLPPMVAQTNSLMGCTFTVSVDVKGRGCTTGVSAYDRAQTILALVDPGSKGSDFARPGHMFPLIPKKGGILERRGHTEAAVELAKFAGLYPAGVIVEILKTDGTMARRGGLFKLAKKYDMKIITVEDIVQYRKKLDS